MTTRSHIAREPCSIDRFADPVVSVRTVEGERHFPFRRAAATQILGAIPWRRARSVRGQKHYSGLYWSATAGSHVMYESRLELARLLLADFDPGVVALAAQPFQMRVRIGDRVRRHVPDFFLVGADRSATVVNVKPAGRLAESDVAEALRWPGEIIAAHGWGYEVWTGEDPIYLANVRFLAGYRRPGLEAEGLLDAVHAEVCAGDRVGSVVARLGVRFGYAEVKAAVLRLLWQHRLSTDLRRRLDADSVLEAAP